MNPFIICETCSKDDSKPWLSEHYLLPDYQLEMVLSPVRYEYERHDYTFVAVLSDFGGFNDGLLLIAYGLTAAYNKSMFQGKFSSMFPVRQNQKSRHQSKRRQAASRLLPKLDAQQDVELSTQQARELSQTASKTMSSYAIGFWHKLCLSSYFVKSKHK